MKSFKVANFRLFRENGVKVNFKPVTIFTGTNSSGKSSFVKSMILMQNYFDAVMKEPTHNPAAVQLDFSDPRLKMSGFEDALNYSCDRTDPIMFSFDVSSDYAPYPFTLEYSFVASDVNRTKGELQSIRLLHDDNLLVKADNVNGRLVFSNIGIKGKLLKAFLIFMKGKLFAEGRRCDDFDVLDGSVSKTGVDISDWSEYFLSPFLRKELDAAIMKQQNSDFAVAVKKYDENGILMFFPVMEDLGKMSKMDAVKYILTAPINEDSIYCSVKSELASKFEASEAESFIEYFKSVEDEELSSFSFRREMDGTLLGGEYLSSLLNNCLSTYNHHCIDVGFKVDGLYEGKNKESYYERICKFFHEWQMQVSQNSDNFIEISKSHIEPEAYTIQSTCRLAYAYQSYLTNFLSEILISNPLKNIITAGNSFTPVQRLYAFEDRSSFVDTVKRYFSLSRTIGLNKASRKKTKTDFIFDLNIGTVDYVPGTFTDKWLKEFGIASHLVIDDDNDGLGFKVFLQKEDSERNVSIADQGHGITQLITILIQIECAIMSRKIEEARGLDAYERSTIAAPLDTILTIEEPEVSLHPSMQSKLALLFEDASRYGIKFIIETHSEYLVRKTQVIVSSMEDKSKNPFCIYYFCSDGSSYELEYTNTGGFDRQFGTGFFDEARGLAMEVINNSNLITEE